MLCKQFDSLVVRRSVVCYEIGNPYTDLIVLTSLSKVLLHLKTSVITKGVLQSE
jgi:hypothetical protein